MISQEQRMLHIFPPVQCSKYYQMAQQIIGWLKQRKYTTMQLQIKGNCTLKGKCRTENIIYNCIMSTFIVPDKAYLGTIDGGFQKRYLNQRSFLKNKSYTNTNLAMYIWEIKQKQNRTPILKCYVVKSVLSYCNVIKTLCFVFTKI